MTLRALGNTSDALTTELNLSLILLDTEQFPQARRELESVMRTCADGGLLAMESVARSLRLPALAAERDWTTWDIALPEAYRLVRETGIADADVSTYVQKAGELCLIAGQPKRARQAFEMALAIERSRGCEEQIETLLQAIDKCET